MKQELRQLSDQDGNVTDLMIEPISMSREDIEARKAELAEVEKLDPAQGTEVIGTQYWNARQGDKLQGIFIGWKPIHSKTEDGEPYTRPAAIIDTSKGTFICSTIQFVEKFRTVPIDSKIFVECTSSVAKQMKEYRVIVLD